MTSDKEGVDLLKALSIDIKNCIKAVITIEARKNIMVEATYYTGDYTGDDKKFSQEITKKFSLKPVKIDD